VIAENPSKFTYHGTGTYLIGGADVAVIDPGPLLDSHRDALAAALRGRRVRAILVTHCHADHSPLAAWLAAETGAPTFAHGPHAAGAAAEIDLGALPDDFGCVAGRDDAGGDGADPVEPAADEADADDADGAGTSGMPKLEESTDTDFVPDVAVATDDVVFRSGSTRVTALHTPGHTSNHTCFALRGDAGRILFTGDHVMGWSTTVVSPPDGDMTDYLTSLRRVAGRDDELAVPTHGPPIPDPGAFVAGLVAHRLAREANVLAAVRRGPTTIPEIVTELYADVRVELHRPAAHSVLAHLVRLVADGRVAVDDTATDGMPRLDSVYRPV
jgi:glyoxylase-like metal-dependent hydrolase (beta-lactamase superfamily II)